MGSFLSKSGYIAGQQCEKLLWLSSHNIEPSLDMDDGAKDRLKVGEEVGNVAKNLFPDGLEIDFNMNDIDLMINQTTEALKSDKPIYEATFLNEDILVRVDLMVKEGEGWNMYEVKSSSSIKNYHYEDAAFQWYALSLVPGLKMNRGYVITINNRYMNNVKTDIDNLFNLTDVTEFVKTEAKNIPDKINSFKEVIKHKDLQDIQIGSQCSKPHSCVYKND